MGATREETVKKDLPRRQLIWRQSAGPLFPLGDPPKAVAHKKPPMSCFGQPGAEGNTVLSGSRLGGSGDFGIDRHGLLHYGHPIMVAPPVPLGSSERQRTTIGRSPARPPRVGDTERPARLPSAVAG